MFLGGFLKNRKEVGSVVQSSPFLARGMVGDEAFAEARNILELGPGLGGITGEIVRRMRPDATLTLVELNGDFCRELRKRFAADARVRVLNLSALALAKHSAEPADYIVSSIPLANMNAAAQEKLFDEVKKALAPKGVFVQFQYSVMSLGLLKKCFSSVGVRFTVLNFPPAFIYVCRM